jgi:hypothetical protein
MGDECRSWDRLALLASDGEAEATVREAERMFNEVQAAGGSAYLIENGRATARIVTFDPSATFILLLPAVIGG